MKVGIGFLLATMLSLFIGQLAITEAGAVGRCVRARDHVRNCERNPERAQSRSGSSQAQAQAWSSIGRDGRRRARPRTESNATSEEDSGVHHCYEYEEDSAVRREVECPPEDGGRR